MGVLRQLSQTLPLLPVSTVQRDKVGIVMMTVMMTVIMIMTVIMTVLIVTVLMLVRCLQHALVQFCGLSHTNHGSG
jgi:hypothetical protein